MGGLLGATSAAALVYASLEALVAFAWSDEASNMAGPYVLPQSTTALPASTTDTQITRSVWQARRATHYRTVVALVALVAAAAMALMVVRCFRTIASSQSATQGKRRLSEERQPCKVSGEHIVAQCARDLRRFCVRSYGVKRAPRKQTGSHSREVLRIVLECYSRIQPPP